MEAIGDVPLVPSLLKCPTGITGLDEITGGGLPCGRTALVCGAAGSGKTLLATEFLVRGATQFDEPGVFLAFEETADELAQNVASLGFDLTQLQHDRKLVVDHVRVERSEIEEAGEYDLSALFIRLAYAIDMVSAKRVVLDTLETLFGGFSNYSILRAELRRLFRWLKDKGVTSILTAERGDGTLTRQGLEEYVSDCVILLDHRVQDQVATRRMRIVKYRGSSHGTNEYPFLISERGLDVLPITSIGLNHQASSERISTGVADLDAMFEGRGFFRGSSVLVSGTAGTGKSSLAATFAESVCRRGERCLYFAFEESPSQIIRNMKSIGIDLGQYAARDLLKFHAVRPTAQGLEMHLATMHSIVRDFRPELVVVDPLSNLFSAGSVQDVCSMLMRLVDHLKTLGITALFTSLNHGRSNLESTDVGISSIIDTWLLLRDLESYGERNRAIYVLKSRGMSHSNQIREFLLTDRGIQLVKPYLGPEGVLTGSARVAQQSRERAADAARVEDLNRQRRISQRKRETLEAQIAALRLELEQEKELLNELANSEQRRQAASDFDEKAMAISRQAMVQEQGGNGQETET